MRNVICLVLTLTVVGLAAAPAEAGIVSTGAGIGVQAPPTGTINTHDVESDTQWLMWEEQTVVLGSALTVEHRVTSGITIDSAGDVVSGVLGPGTMITSYMLHFDAVNDNQTLTNAVDDLVVTFDTPILGVIVGSYGATDAVFTPVGTTYGTLAARVLELGGGGSNERFTISADLMTLTILNSRTTTGVDHLRVLTNPEPGTWALFGFGVLGLGGVVRRRRRKRAAAAAATSTDGR